MRFIPLLTLLLAAHLGLASIAVAQQKEKTVAPTSSTSFSNYKAIADRSIFDPNRHPVATKTVAVATPVVATPKQTPSVSSRFALVGIMIQDDQAHAFFKGTPTNYEGSYKLNSTFGVFKLAGIFTDRVILLQDNTRYELNVGQQLEERNGQWSVSAYVAPVSSTPAASSPTTGITPRVGTTNTMPNAMGNRPNMMGGMPQPGGSEDEGSDDNNGPGGGGMMPPGGGGNGPGGMDGGPGGNSGPPGETASAAPANTPASGAKPASPAGTSSGNDMLKRLQERRQRGE
ncbi:TPA: hypothetical protein DDW35_06100 [Candidatus Sumerlaeota bacterium]|jgi:hypothetical protein|nr:hypothetical protein [Candidatus Sumerlaeota bacterium]